MCSPRDTVTTKTYLTGFCICFQILWLPLSNLDTKKWPHSVHITADCSSALRETGLQDIYHITYHTGKQ